ncbi:hypothetical protein DFP73DRAFT_557977 [Morchella snyderi]|nr:hypothetical protein DFP73DRAFT_557977 [Morchella snyderi]
MFAVRGVWTVVGCLHTHGCCMCNIKAFRHRNLQAPSSQRLQTKYCTSNSNSNKLPSLLNSPTPSILRGNKLHLEKTSGSTCSLLISKRARSPSKPRRDSALLCFYIPPPLGRYFKAAN